MSVLSETRERFLNAIVGQVPAERIVEIHFFQPMKQAGVESGVAVVAAEEPADVPQGDVERAVVEEEPPADAPAARYTVYTARYRLALKGPDRGKWDASVVAEADAPLITVDAVVRGVQRRSGDVEEPDRMSGDDVRAFAEKSPTQPNGRVA